MAGPKVTNKVAKFKKFDPTSYVPIVPFLEELFYLSNGELVKLADWQKAFFNKVCTPDENGILPYKHITFSCIKKSGKSTCAAMLICWYAFSGIAEPNNEIILAANSVSQANERVYVPLRKAIEQSPYLRNECNKIHDKGIELKNGTVIKSIASEYSTAAGSNQGLSCFDELWGFTCIPLKYKENFDLAVLTIDGWKHPSDITMEDLVATRAQTGELEYQKPEYITNQEYNGELYNFKHRRCEFAVTPNHRILATYASNAQERSDILNGKIVKKEEYKFARDAANEAFGFIPTQASWSGQDSEYIEIGGIKYNSKDFAEFLGWYIAEGYLIKNDNGPIGFSISQSKEKNLKKYNRIKILLEKLFSDPVHAYKNDIRIRNRSVAEYLVQFGKSHEKYVPQFIKNASQETINRFLDGYLNGDGWKTKSNGWQAYTVSEILRDDLLELGLKTGWTPRYMGISKTKGHHKIPIGQNWNPEKHKPCYRISFSKGNVSWERRMKHWSTINYSGPIWCVTVPNQNFYLRYNGNCFWTGNSPRDQELWTELTPPPTRTNAMRFVSTYSGIPGVSNLLENIYKAMVKPENFCDIGDFMNYETGETTKLPCYVKGDSIALWDTEGRMPWHIPEYFESELIQPGMTRNGFLRIHRNQWVTDESGLDMEQWDDCVSRSLQMDPPYDKPIGPSTRIQLAVGIDASLVKDRTSVVSVFKKDGKIWLGPRKTWQPSKENPLDFKTTVIPYIQELNKKYFVSAGFYDPWQMESVGQDLRRMGIPIQPWPQTIPNTTRMTENLLDLLRERNLVLYPDEELRREATMVTLKDHLDGRGRRITKQSSNLKIDSIISLALACLAGSSTLPDMEGFKNQIFRMNTHRRRR